MSDAIAIAVAQTVPRRGGVAANVDEHLALARLAAREGARTVLFPELSLTGYELDLADELAFTPLDARLDPLRSEAASLGATFVVGAPVRHAEKLMIGAFVLTPGGAIDFYTKQRLGAFGESARADGDVPPAEESVFDAGRFEPLVPLGDDEAGHGEIAICADVGDARHAARAAARGARVYFASMFVIPSVYAAEQTRLSGHARERRLAVAMANYGGASGGLAAAGRSTIWNRDGEPLIGLPPAGAGVAVALEDDAGWRVASALRGG